MLKGKTLEITSWLILFCCVYTP